MQGPPGQDPADAALSAFISPRSAASAGRALGLSPADKELLAADRERAETLTSTIGDAARLHQDAMAGFRDQSQAALEDATVGRMVHEQSLAEDARHRAAIEADYKQSQAKIGAKLDELSAQGVDPNHYWQSRSTAEKIGAAIAVAMGAFAAHPLGPHGTASDNTALGIINGAVAADIDAQKANLAHQMTLLGKRQDLAREGFDVNLAMLKAHRDSIESAYQVASRDVDRRVALYKDNADLQQKAAQLKAGLAQSKEELIRPLQDQIYQVKKRAETVVPGAGPSAKLQEQIIKRAQELADKAAEAGKEMSPADARRRAASEIIGVDVKPGEALPSYAKPPKEGEAGKLSPRLVAKIADLNSAEQSVRELNDLFRSGSSLSMSDRARAEAAAANLRKQGFTTVPEQPLEVFSRTGPRQAALATVLRDIQLQRKTLMTQGAGSGSDTPEALGLEED